MEVIIEEIYRALGYLMIAGVVLFAWKQAFDSARGKKVIVILAKGLLWCVGIALFASLTLGNPNCTEQVDVVYGGCAEYADDSFEPSAEQRAANFAYFMTLLYIPVVIGAFAGSKKSAVN